jgi:hypothetical protein
LTLQDFTESLYGLEASGSDFTGLNFGWHLLQIGNIWD